MTKPFWERCLRPVCLLPVAAAIAAAVVAGCKKDDLSAVALTTAPGIVDFRPDSGAVGEKVIISGAYFSMTPANDTVRFNGTPAVVSSAAPGQLTVTVPPGATTGPVSVTVGAATCVSREKFTVR